MTVFSQIIIIIIINTVAVVDFVVVFVVPAAIVVLRAPSLRRYNVVVFLANFNCYSFFTIFSR